MLGGRAFDAGSWLRARAPADGPADSDSPAGATSPPAGAGLAVFLGPYAVPSDPSNRKR